MVRTGKHLWAQHPHVDNDLTVGERWADRLKAGFGSWAFLGLLNGFIVVWAILNWTGVVHFDVYPFIALNLVLSWLAAQQGGALQIAANRGDKKSAELALATHANGEKLLALNEQQLTILDQQDQVMAQHSAMLATLDQLQASVAATQEAIDALPAPAPTSTDEQLRHFLTDADREWLRAQGWTDPAADAEHVDPPGGDT